MRKCPKCGSKKVSTERRPNGDSKCGECFYSNATVKFDNPQAVVESDVHHWMDKLKDYAAIRDESHLNTVVNGLERALKAR
jgi:transcription elongation factor Elf1